jgi:hypothetical protein
LNACPSAEKSPVSETDTPIRIGDLLPPPEAPLPPLEPQAARIVAVATEAAAMDKNRVR